jgi:hypothetical protein
MSWVGTANFGNLYDGDYFEIQILPRPGDMVEYRLTEAEGAFSLIIDTIEPLEKKIREICDDEQEIFLAMSWVETANFGNLYDGDYFEIQILPIYEY